MKKIYGLLFLIAANNVNAQSYIPFPESNAVWIQGLFLYNGYNGHEHATITQPLSFGNDVVMGGQSYHSLHGSSNAEWIDGWGNPQAYQTGSDVIPDVTHVLFRQDVPNKLIYQWDNSTSQEQVLYDFGNLVVGQPYPQTINNMDYPQIMVMAYDSVMLNDGLYHEKWVLGSNASDSGFVSIIEGVGSTMGFNLPIAIPFEQSSATLCMSSAGAPVYDGWGNVNALIAPVYSVNCNAILYSIELEDGQLDVAVWPNPVSDLLSIESPERMSKIVLCDLLGHQLLEQNGHQLKNAQVSMNDLPSGNYMLLVFTDADQIVTKRIVK